MIFICTCVIKPIPSPPKCAYADEIADAIRALWCTGCDGNATDLCNTRKEANNNETN
ncbi:MAG: hypothetical protein U9N07_02130 [Euryarchaeota archaeon]|nr:hypothetical protein [Euryarchaeota archaeon]